MEKDYQYDLVPENFSGRKVVFSKGLGSANVHNLRQPREFNEVESKFFPSLKAADLMTYGLGSKWDERKYRLDRIQLNNQDSAENDDIFVHLGLTYYGAHEADINRGDDANKALKLIGEAQHKDEWAYFARCLATAFVPITTDGSVFVGEKIGENNAYGGRLSSAAGNVDFHGGPSFEKFKSQAVTELREEYGERLQLIGKPRFIGIASHPLKGDADAVWVGRIDVSAEYFTSGKWLEERKDVEHSQNLVQIATTSERDLLLNEMRLNGRGFKGMVYSTRLGLEYLTQQDFQSL